MEVRHLAVSFLFKENNMPQMGRKEVKEKIIEGLAGIASLPIIGGVFAYFTKASVMAGVLGGLGIGVLLLAVYGLGYLISERIKTALHADKRWPYILAALVVSLIISTSLALNLGQASCTDYEYDNRGGSCSERGNDGYTATDSERWGKFWATMPIATTISLLIAAYVHKNRTRK
jgi:hypothetical protein